MPILATSQGTYKALFSCEPLVTLYFIDSNTAICSLFITTECESILDSILQMYVYIYIYIHNIYI